MEPGVSQLSIELLGDWLGGAADVDDATFGALVIRADNVPLTEVHDAIAESTRPAIRVPMVRVARWLLTEWWRLRWEPKPATTSLRWRESHSMAAVGGGVAWPDLEIASDGEFVQLSIKKERARDAAAIRYLQGGFFEVAAAEWERAVDRFVEHIEARIVTVLPDERELTELRNEIQEERADARQALQCRREAIAGYASGDAPEGWHASMRRLAAEVGEDAIDDLLAPTRGGPAAWAAVDALKRSSVHLDLGEAAHFRTMTGDGAKPWERGVATARRARKHLGIGPGPVSNERLAEVVGHQFPLGGDAIDKSGVLGGFRPRDGGGATSVRAGAKRRTTQRFFVARLLGTAALLPNSEQVLALTSMVTAQQKFARAFGREMLVPWEELDAFTDEEGVGEDAVALAADYYDVSEMLIAATLVNYGKLDRERLDVFAG